MLDNFNAKMTEGIKDITDCVKDTINLGYKIDETLPATTYKEVEVNGKTYLMKIEVSILKSK